MHREAQSHRIEYVDAGQNVGRRIDLIEKRHQHAADIACIHIIRTKVEPVRVQQGYDQEDRHSHHQNCRDLVGLLHGSLEHDPGHNGNVEAEPQEIRDDEIFAERNLLIQPCVNNMVMHMTRAFQQMETDHIDRDICQDPE